MSGFIFRSEAPLLSCCCCCADVGIEVQNPFGLDKSDLSICLLTDQFQKQIAETLSNYVDEDLPDEVVLQKKLDEYVDRRGLEHYPDQPEFK